MNALEIGWFAASALLVLGGALVTIVARKPVRCAMGLLTTILGIASCYLLLSAELLAAIQLIVYAGGVVVLFLFVVMLLGAGATTANDGAGALPRFSAALLFLLLAAAGIALLVSASSAAQASWPAAPPTFGSIEAVGREIFTQKIIAFELTGLLLLVAVIGAMAVARGKHADPTRPSPTEPSHALARAHTEEAP